MAAATRARWPRAAACHAGTPTPPPCEYDRPTREQLGLFVHFVHQQKQRPPTQPTQPTQSIPPIPPTLEPAAAADDIAAGALLYDPASPWGVLGIAYDPASPRLPWLGVGPCGVPADDGPPAKRQRTASPPPKREATPEGVPEGVEAATTTPAASPDSARPQPNWARDRWFRAQALRELRAGLARAAAAAAAAPPGTPPTHGAVANAAVAGVLAAAAPPNVDAARGAVDAHFATGAEARALVEAGAVARGVPVVTAGEQAFAWAPGGRPIAELFRRMEHLDRRVAVQVPSRPSTGDSFATRSLEEVAARFLGEGAGDIPDADQDHQGGADQDDQGDPDPWNVLDLYSPLPPATLPRFLTGENCQLLPRVRDEVLRPARAERGAAPRARWPEWNAWRDVLEWVLLAQGGHHTAPHTDSHGLATWLTVQEGLFGFGWLARPPRAVQAAWAESPLSVSAATAADNDDVRWRYTVLEPGQTVFFDSGTVHFVFRLRRAPTLALGGHVLLWTGIGGWLDTVAAQLARPDTTNEDMAGSAPLYVRAVARLVAARVRAGRVAALGGAAAARALLARLEAFADEHAPPSRRKRRRRR